jgi:hypothetical protein
VPGDIRLGILQHVLDIANAELSVQQQIHDPYPIRILKRFENGL